MEPFENQLSNYYDWSLEYSKQAIFEYLRFLFIKNQYPIQTTPSINIYKVWIFHMGNIQNYVNYCIGQYQKIIDHNPFEYKEMIGFGGEKFEFTKSKYMELFGQPIYSHIWLQSITLPYPISIEPEYKKNVFFLQKSEIKIFIYYMNQVGLHHMEIVPYKPSIAETIGNIKQLIMNYTKVDMRNIDIYVHSQIPLDNSHKNSLMKDNMQISKLISLHRYDFFIAILSDKKN